ncbi:MAG: type II secretion system F family protein [Bifidobacteriaceae bacterium]|nr:type II secretion system F family protein [Bifidobacteriaceae bacterium]
MTLGALAEAVEQVAALARAGLAGPELWAPLLAAGGGDGKDRADSSGRKGAPAAWPFSGLLADRAPRFAGPVGAPPPGRGPGDELAGWSARLASTPVGPYAAAVAAIHRVATDAGASAAALLGSVSGALADAEETADALDAAMAGPKSSARMLQFLPLMGLVLGGLMGAAPLPVLFGGGAGTVALIAGLALIAVGKLWSDALVRAASRPPSTDPLVAGVLAAALRAGLVLPAALRRVGEAWPGQLGAILQAAGRQLARGQSWDAAWESARAEATGACAQFAEALCRALRPVWESGAEAGPLLEGLAARAARAERRRLRQAAARLGVHLMAPLGLCYLPAFIALGLAPVVLSFADSLLPGLA